MNDAGPLATTAGLALVVALIAAGYYAGRLPAALRARLALYRRRRDVARWRRTQAAARARGVDV